MNLLIIPSDNGLGHIRRSIILANHLCKRLNISILLNERTKSKFFVNKKKIIILIKKIFQIKNKNYSYLNKKKINELINNYEYIWIDNFADLSTLNKKIILYYNFLWHKNLKLNHKKFMYLDKEIKKNISFGNYLFQKRYFKNQNNKLIPFFEKFKSYKNRKAVLIALGTSDYKKTKLIKKTLKKYFKKQNIKNIKFYIDPKIFDNEFKKMGFVKADFSTKMYKEVKFAIIKPGLGTIEECLKRGIIIISYTKNTYSEFFHNSKILIKNKLGYSFQTIEKSVNFIIKNFDNIELIKQHENNCKNLKWEGEKKVEKYLLKRANI